MTTYKILTPMNDPSQFNLQQQKHIVEAAILAVVTNEEFESVESYCAQSKLIAAGLKLTEVSKEEETFRRLDPKSYNNLIILAELIIIANTINHLFLDKDLLVVIEERKAMGPNESHLEGYIWF